MENNLRIAIPTQGGQICMHFGHCEKFTIVDVKASTITKQEELDPPVHQPGAYPKYLAGHHVDVIIAGGMGMKAQQLFNQNNIEVFLGVQAGSPAELVQAYLDKQLETGKNLCDH